jgi:hypothetical protein
MSGIARHKCFALRRGLGVMRLGRNCDFDFDPDFDFDFDFDFDVGAA